MPEHKVSDKGVAFLEPSDDCWRPQDSETGPPVYFSCPSGERLEVRGH